MAYASILYRGKLFFTHYHAVGVFGETDNDQEIDRKGVDKLLEAVKS